MNYTIIIQKDAKDGGYSAQCAQIPEAISQGDTMDELMENMREAILLAIDCRNSDLKEKYKGMKTFYRQLAV